MGETLCLDFGFEQMNFLPSRSVSLGANEYDVFLLVMANESVLNQQLYHMRPQLHSMLFFSLPDQFKTLMRVTSSARAVFSTGKGRPACANSSSVLPALFSSLGENPAEVNSAAVKPAFFSNRASSSWTLSSAGLIAMVPESSNSCLENDARSKD